MLRLNLIGNLGADAQVKDFEGRKAVCFNVAHTDRWTDENDVKHESTTWVSCIWNGDGGKTLPYLKRGTTVFVSGPCSTRVFSSPKEHRMVAGLNLRVDNIELIGGKVDDVPSQLINHDGVLFDTHKFFCLRPEDVKAIQPDEAGKRIIFDRQGHQYDIAEAGWITPIQSDSSQSAETETTEQGSGEQAEEPAKTSKAKSKK